HICRITDGVMHTRDLCPECLESSATIDAGLAPFVGNARCEFCGAPATTGGTDTLALCGGEEHFNNFCLSCSEEYCRYTDAAMERMPKSLSRQQQVEAFQQLRRDADKHMKDWLSRRPQ